MKISPVASNMYYKNSNYSNNNSKKSPITFPTVQYAKSNITFGYCYPHMEAASTLNSKFGTAISNILAHELSIKNDLANKNFMKKMKYSLLDDAAAKAASLFSQYCNMQYSVAEFLPTYAVTLNKSLVESIKEMEVFKDPIKTFVAINDITKMEMKAGIDKNTGAEYTQNQTQRAKAGTQLYTVAFMLQQLQNSIEKTENQFVKSELQALFNMVNKTLDETYGENTLQRILELSGIGPNPTYEQKVASINLMKEFDAVGKELHFSKEFEKGLQALIDSENNRLEKTIENEGQGITSSMTIKLKYHTHAHGDDHHHVHHEKMTEEEHRRYHLEKEKEKL